MKKQQKELEKQARDYELNKKAIDEANAKKEAERLGIFESILQFF